MSRFQFAAALAVIAVVTSVRIAMTHAVFSPTYDEAVHVAAGHEYWSVHRYTTDRSHPPLSRMVFAFPLRHARLTGDDGFDRAGQLYESAGDYMRGVIVSRRGNLLFVVLAIIGVALWTVQLMGRVAAVIAAAIFALLPQVLAHGGLATTDMSGAAGFALAMAAFQWWLASTTWPRTALLALAIGFGMVGKMSFPMFFAIGAVALMVLEKKWPMVKGIVALVGALVVVDAVYFFGKLALYFKGFRDLMNQNFRGFESYFLGRIGTMGWWNYFPVLLLIKTPIPALVLMMAGIVITLWNARRVLNPSAAEGGRSAAVDGLRTRSTLIIVGLMLALVMMSSINRGVRHVLPLYVPLSMLSAYAVVTLWPTRAKWAITALGGWLIVNSATAHPDYLPWANALAGRHPERIALDSNFDWGQDVLRLSEECRRRGITSLHAALFGMIDARRIGLPPVQPIDDMHGAPGWYAISESIVIPAQVRNRDAYRWLTDGRDFIRVGKTIRLYHVG